MKKKIEKKALEPKEIAIKETSPELTEVMNLGNIFVKSGMFKDVKSQAQAVVKILYGRELKLTPIESMTNIYFVNDKLALPAKLISALIKRSGMYDYTETECGLTFTKNGKVIGKSMFTFKDAAKAGLVNKDNWKNYPRNMLFARALTNGARWYCPDVFSGYAVEELSDTKIEKPVEVVSFTPSGKVKTDEK